MSPPEIWGPAIWTLFHTLAAKIYEPAYSSIFIQLFNNIRNICSVLPCPECSKDASTFLAKINVHTLKNKEEFIKNLYLFHNFVNKKKQKPLFNYANINIYNNFSLINTIKNFTQHYNTKGNMKLLNESFQRQMIIKNFKQWIIININAFVKPILVQSIKPVNNSDIPLIDTLDITD